ncbi:MAG: hypothetical protein J0H68_09260 [Sphingobacteriia bacterium]|nr:hypothetical protein [Sphingobacteriia bacterium]
MSDIDIVKIYEIVFRSLKRAQFYSGIANHILKLSINNIELEKDKPSDFQIVFPDWFENQNQYKKTFAEWVMNRLLEDMIESFEQCLERIFKILPIKEEFKDKANKIKDLNGFISKFEKNIGIPIKYSESIRSLNIARDILTHSYEGYVRKDDVNGNDNKFTVHWYKLKTKVYGKKQGENYKTEKDILNTWVDTRQFDNHNVKFERTFIKKSKSWNIDECIQFTPYEIHEISSMIDFIIKDFHYNLRIKALKIINLNN